MMPPTKFPALIIDRARLKLEGSCNRCGLCCTVNGLRCHNLRVDTILGLPGASFCKAYEIRYPGMPIMMMKSDGQVGALGACAHGSAADAEIIAEWIGKGCSLQIKKGT